MLYIIFRMKKLPLSEPKVSAADMTESWEKCDFRKERLEMQEE